MGNMNLPKPKINEPCNGCGLCCKIQVCMNGAYVLKLVAQLGQTVQGPCPALVINKNGSYGCGIVINPNKYIKSSKYPAAVLSKNFSHLIGAGTGCDELLENDTEDEEDKLNQTLESLKNNNEWRKKSAIAIKVIHGLI